MGLQQPSRLKKCPLTGTTRKPTFRPPFLLMSTEQKQQSLTPEQVPFTSPQLFSRYITDTGKILPRKYTGLSAKQQRKVTKTIKTGRNTLTMQ
jgi:small subunit ribosomal protein S18